MSLAILIHVGFPRALRESVSTVDSLVYDFRVCPQAGGQGREPAEPQAHQSSVGKLQCTWDWGRWGQSSKCWQFPKSSCLQRRGCTSQAASPTPDSPTELLSGHPSETEALLRRSSPSSLRTSPFFTFSALVVTRYSVPQTSSGPHLVSSSSLHLSSSGALGLMRVLIKGPLSTWPANPNCLPARAPSPLPSTLHTAKHFVS